MHGVVERRGINQARAAEFLLAERHLLIFHSKRFAAVELFPVRARLVSCVHLLVRHARHIVADMLAAVQRDHGIPVCERVCHFFIRFEVVAVRAEPLLKILAENRERCAVQHVRKCALCQSQLTDGLLGEHGKRVVLLKHAQMPGRRDAETVAHAERAQFPQHRLWRGKRKQLAQQNGVFVRQRREEFAVHRFA